MRDKQIKFIDKYLKKRRRKIKIPEIAKKYEWKDILKIYIKNNMPVNSKNLKYLYIDYL